MAVIDDCGVPVELIETTLTDEELWTRAASGQGSLYRNPVMHGGVKITMDDEYHKTVTGSLSIVSGGTLLIQRRAGVRVIATREPSKRHLGGAWLLFVTGSCHVSCASSRGLHPQDRAHGSGPQSSAGKPFPPVGPWRRYLSSHRQSAEPANRLLQTLLVLPYLRRDGRYQVIKLNAYFLCITAKIFNCHTFQSHVFSLLMKQPG